MKLMFSNERLMSLVRKFPGAYMITKAYSLVASVIGTRVREKWWAKRSIAGGYWENRNHPSKHFLADRIAAFSPIKSIFELGCNSGPNLYLLAKRFPEAKITGIDINKEAIKYGSTQFAKEGLSNVKLLVGRADKLEEFPDRAFDVVFTNAVLTHIGPTKIDSVLTELFRITRRVLILMEPHSFGLKERELLKLGLMTYYGGQWIRNYMTILKEFVSEKQIKVTKLPDGIWNSKPWKELGAVLEITKDLEDQLDEPITENQQ